MKLYKQFNVIYTKPPLKRKSCSYDGILKVYSTLNTFILYLYDDNEIEILRRSLPIKNTTFELNNEVTFNGYVITLESVIEATIGDLDIIEDDEHSFENIQPIKTFNCYSTSLKKPEILAKDRTASSVLTCSKKFVVPSSTLSSNNSSTTVKRSLNMKLDMNKKNKSNNSGQEEETPSSILIENKHLNLKPFKSVQSVNNISSQYINDIKSNEFVPSIDNRLRRLMRLHQIDAAEWILEKFQGINVTIPDNINNDEPTCKDDLSFLDNIHATLEDIDVFSDDEDFDYIHRSCSQTTYSNVNGAILADEMGLGKTLVAISVIWAYIGSNRRFQVGASPKAIVVCPSSLIDNWEKEVRKWMGVYLQPLCVRSNMKGSKGPQEIIKSFHYTSNSSLLIISYDMYRKYHAIINEIRKVEIIVCDEGHRLKNIGGTKTIAALNDSSADKRLILSGTPIQNDLDELFAIVSFVRPGLLGDKLSFQSNISVPISKGNDKNSTDYDKRISKIAANQLKNVMSIVMLRRTQTDILSKYLTVRYDYIVHCNMSIKQLEQYREIASEIFNSLNISKDSPITENYCKGDYLTSSYFFLPTQSNNDIVSSNVFADSKPLASTTVLPGLQKLRRVCNGYMANNEYTKTVRLTSGTNNDMLQNSIKLQIIEEIVKAVVSRKDLIEKIVIVSNFLTSLDEVALLAQRRGWEYMRLDGSLATDKRQQLVDAFNRPSDHRRIFLLSSKAGGVGINLIGGSRLVMMDCDWNPATDSQAMSRIWRDGQIKPVHIYRLISQDVIEDAIIMRQRSKTALASLINDESIESFKSNEKMSLTTTDVINLIQPKFQSSINSKSINNENILNDESNENQSVSSNNEDSNPLLELSSDPVVTVLERLKSIKIVNNFEVNCKKCNDTVIKSI